MVRRSTTEKSWNCQRFFPLIPLLRDRERLSSDHDRAGARDSRALRYAKRQRAGSGLRIRTGDLDPVSIAFDEIVTVWTAGRDIHAEDAAFGRNRQFGRERTNSRRLHRPEYVQTSARSHESAPSSEYVHVVQQGCLN